MLEWIICCLLIQRIQCCHLFIRQSEAKQIQILYLAFDQMPIRHAVLTLAVPTVISQLIVMVYNLADTWFIGQTGDPFQVAAVTLAYPLFMLLSAFANLFGIGGSSLISRLLGRQDADSAGRVGTFSIWAAAGVSVLYALIVRLFGRDLLEMMGAESMTLEFALQYLNWTVVIGGLPTVLNMALGNIIRAQGKAKTASYGMSLGGLLNIILDPIFIFSLKMNVAGAALATALSNTVSMVYLLTHVIVNRDRSIVKLTVFPKSITKTQFIEILSIGTPAALQIVLAALSNSVMLRLLNGYEATAVSGLGIEHKVEIIPFQIVQGISSGILPLVAYNHASGNRKRRDEAISFALRLGLAVSGVLFILIELVSPQIVRFFIANEDTIRYGAAFTRLRCLALPFINIEFMLIAVFQAIGGAKEALLLSFYRKGLIDLPLMVLANIIWPLYGLMLVQPFMECTGSIIALLLYRKERNQ